MYENNSKTWQFRSLPRSAGTSYEPEFLWATAQGQRSLSRFLGLALLSQAVERMEAMPVEI